jgi:hypothetical protein
VKNSARFEQNSGEHRYLATLVKTQVSQPVSLRVVSGQKIN